MCYFVPEYLTVSESQLPYWTRSGFGTEGLLKSLEDLFGQAQTTFGVLMSLTRNSFSDTWNPLIVCHDLGKHLAFWILMSTSFPVQPFNDSTIKGFRVGSFVEPNLRSIKLLCWNCQNKCLETISVRQQQKTNINLELFSWLLICCP